MVLISDMPVWYWVVAILLSCYYAYRGYVGNWVSFAQKNEAIPDGKRKYAKWEVVSVYCLHDMIFHFVCAMAGFLTLHVAFNLSQSVVSGQGADVGKSILLVFCFLFGVVGVTGQLPSLIQQGKLPGLRQ